jgi:hypothetical protein
MGQKTLFPKNLKEATNDYFLRQLFIERIQTSIIHLPPCPQEIIDNENPNFLRFFLKMRNEAVWLPW